jgi:hypothetical protein
MLKRSILLVSAAMLVVTGAAPALACGGLVGRNGAVNLLRTTTLAAYHEGVEHYVTSFEFAGGGGAFGSIVPLPAIPSNVERGGDWTLQRLIRETKPQPVVAFAAAAETKRDAEVVYETRIDALDITVLKGGGDEVGAWAKKNGFNLSPDAPEVLDFYGSRSPIFMAARFDASAAKQRGQQLGDGTPIHLTIPTDNPWVPLRILGLGRLPQELVQADIYLLTGRRPGLLPGPVKGFRLNRDAEASSRLLDDLRSDKGMSWVPVKMWLSHLELETTAEELRYDLAIDASGAGQPSKVDAGLTVASKGEAPLSKPADSPAIVREAGRIAVIMALWIAAVSIIALTMGRRLAA